MCNWKRVCIIVWAIFAAMIAGQASAQQEDLFADEAGLLDILDDEDKNELVVAPIPIVNPTFGYGLAAVAMYLYKLDEGSQQSFTAAGGAYTDSKSYGFGIAQVAHFKDDAWKIKAGAASFNFNLEFFGIGNILGNLGTSIPYTQEG